MEEGIKQGQKPFKDLSISKEDLTKLSSYLKKDIIKGLKLSGYIKEGTLQSFLKLSGIILTMGIFIVAIVSTALVTVSFFINTITKRLDDTNIRIDNINIRLDKLEARQAISEKEFKEFQKEVYLKFDQILERLPKQK